MSGHSKWNNIKGKKEKSDAQRGKIFTKISREIIVAVKNYGSDINTNTKLKELIVKAKTNNVPMDNINRLISKIFGGLNKDNYEEIIYEGYGPCGIALMIQTLTDNKNRTVSDLRYYFDKFGGNLGQSGSVSFLFKKVGAMTIKNTKINDEQLLQECSNLDIDDFVTYEDEVIIYTYPEKLTQVRDELRKKYDIIGISLEEKPISCINVTDEKALDKMEKLLGILEDHDDVQKVWHNLKYE